MNHNITTLNDLIETLKDGQEGFRAAAEDVQSAELRTLFGEYSRQRAGFIVDLQTLAVAEGETTPDTDGSVAGALHRGWIDLKAALTTKNDHAILAECERGEDSAVAAYKKALADTSLAGQVRATLQSQAIEVQAAHDRVRQLRYALADK